MNKLIFLLIFSCNIFGAEFSQMAKDMHKACATGDLDKVKSLVAEGADINMGNYISAMPLYIASEKGNLDIVEYLLSIGANIHSRGYYGSPLSAACAKGHLNIVKCLLANGANINYTHPCSNRRPLNEAVDNEHGYVVHYLVNWMKTNNIKIIYE